MILNATEVGWTHPIRRRRHGRSRWRSASMPLAPSSGFPHVDASRLSDHIDSMMAGWSVPARSGPSAAAGGAAAALAARGPVSSSGVSAPPPPPPPPQASSGRATGQQSTAAAPAAPANGARSRAARFRAASDGAAWRPAGPRCGMSIAMHIRII